MGKSNEKHGYGGLILTAVIALIFVFGIWWFVPDQKAGNFLQNGPNPDQTKALESAALYGDSYGSVNALFSGVAFVGIIVTILLQMRELRETRLEMETQSAHLEAQSQQMAAQAESMRSQVELLIKQSEFSQAQIHIMALTNLTSVLPSLIEGTCAEIREWQGEQKSVPAPEKMSMSEQRKLQEYLRGKFKEMDDGITEMKRRYPDVNYDVEYPDLPSDLKTKYFGYSKYRKKYKRGLDLVSELIQYRQQHKEVHSQLMGIKAKTSSVT